jgi:hypothetical protein
MSPPGASRIDPQGKKTFVGSEEILRALPTLLKNP